MPNARPLFNNLWTRFLRVGRTPAAIAAVIGGAVGEKIEAGEIRDLGALRLSHALLATGIVIPQGTQRTLAGADGRAYFHRSQDIAKFLTEQFGGPDAAAHAASDRAWGSSKGIVLLHSALSAQGGSLTLWNGRQGADPIALAAAHQSQFWALV